MCTMQCLFALVAFFSTANAWEIAITRANQIEFYLKNGNGTYDQNEKDIKSDGLSALAYDAVFNMLLYVDTQSDNASIFRYNLSDKKSQALVAKKAHEEIQGVAFDPITRKVFWTDSNAREKGIYWKDLDSKTHGQKYGQKYNFSMVDKKPRAIAVDSCRGYIYWTNIDVDKPGIERARIDGVGGSEIIVNMDVFRKPMSIAVDQQTRKIYWAEEGESSFYSIESADLDGRNRKTIVAGKNHKLNALAISKDNIYGIDSYQNLVWNVSKVGHDLQQLFSFPKNQNPPSGVVANYSIEDQTAGIPECVALKNLSQNKTAIIDTEMIPFDSGVLCLHGLQVDGKSECKCSPGYTGERCEIDLCQNYCVHGKCTYNSTIGQPLCSCPAGFHGRRCEVDYCFERCLNGGTCAIRNQIPTCVCPEGSTGPRCEYKDNCNCSSPSPALEDLSSDGDFVQVCSNSWDPLRDPIIMVLGALCGILTVVCAVLVAKIMKLKKRPRIKKRIIVQKNSTPLTARPDQCEITIENCCNMNICETPCFEPISTIRPNLLDAKPGKEEKKNLISNMELPDDY